MSNTRASFAKDREAIVLKFSSLIKKAEESVRERQNSTDGMVSPGPYFEARTSALNLLRRIAGENNIYYHELANMERLNPGVMLAILRAAQTDYCEGFMVDAKLLVSAEVLTDILTQAEVLLDNDYKDAAAVIIRSVLEDGLRRICNANGISVSNRDGVAQLADKLVKNNSLTALQRKEIDANKQIGNDAAHARFDQYTADDVNRFREYVLRFLAEMI